MICQSCNSEVSDNLVTGDSCPSCGIQIGEIVETFIKESNKNWYITFFVCLFLMPFGIHRFYAGRTKSAIIYILLFPLIGPFWWLFDLWWIFTGNFKDKNGHRIFHG